MRVDELPYPELSVAPVEGESLVGRAFALRGRRFGAWDRADLDVPDCDEIRIDFSSCDRASSGWTPDGEAGVVFPGGPHGDTAAIDVRSDGSICLRLAPNSSAPCEYRGRLDLAYTGAPFVDFVIERGTGPMVERYEGLGWLEGFLFEPSRVELVLVGRGQDQSGWGIAALRQ